MLFLLDLVRCFTAVVGYEIIWLFVKVESFVGKTVMLGLGFAKLCALL